MKHTLAESFLMGEECAIALCEVESIQDGSMKAKVDALLVTTTDGFFVCNECRYGSKSESHVREHVEMHIEGFAHKCPNCHRTFSKRSSFKFHLNKCQKK